MLFCFFNVVIVEDIYQNKSKINKILSKMFLKYSTRYRNVRKTLSVIRVIEVIKMFSQFKGGWCYVQRYSFNFSIIHFFNITNDVIRCNNIHHMNGFPKGYDL